MYTDVTTLTYIMNNLKDYVEFVTKTPKNSIFSSFLFY